MTQDKHSFMDRKTELRKLKPAYMSTLVNLLSDRDNWIKLLGAVPKELDSPDSDKRYTNDHIRLIENHSAIYKMQPAEVFLQEWSIAGKNRPKIEHLLNLLVEVQLWRAADFVATKFLSEPPPKRPPSGPSARVPIYPLTSTDRMEFEHHFENISDPSGLSSNSEIQIPNMNLNVQNQVTKTLEKLILNPASMTSSSENASTSTNNTISNTSSNNISNKTILTQVQSDTASAGPSIQSNQTAMTSISNDNQSSVVKSPTQQLPCLLRLLTNSAQQPVQVSNQNLVSENSDLIDFKSNEHLVPEFSKLLASQSDQILLPDISKLLNSQSNENILPKISKLLSTSSNQIVLPEISKFFDTNSSNEFTPSALLNAQNTDNLTINKQSSNVKITNENNTISTTHMPSSSEVRPAFSSLLTNQKTENSSNSDILNAVDFSQSPISLNNIPNIDDLRRPSNYFQPALPEIEVHTDLPKLTYTELELYTNNFNDDTYSPNENNSGRHLGSGAFGSVYLAVGLMNRNVAVKRLNLNGEVMSIDGISRLFKNEVEILSKYQHTNLVSLLGYSCDGPTYCLVYEHVCSGSLRSKLSFPGVVGDSNILSWKERINIAHGTSVGISYLHTAYKMPLIHRDIKSENILLTEDNTPKLCDFGLVRLTPDQTTNFTQQIFGTSAYMAPEAFRGDLSTKMDTFSFGVVLFELLTSLPPLDESREGKDLVTFIVDRCDDGLGQLVDLRTGTWIHGDINYSGKLFELANLCIEEKKKRPTMVGVRDQLQIFVDCINRTTEVKMENYN